MLRLFSPCGDHLCTILLMLFVACTRTHVVAVDMCPSGTLAGAVTFAPTTPGSQHTANNCVLAAGASLTMSGASLPALLALGDISEAAALRFDRGVVGAAGGVVILGHPTLAASRVPLCVTVNGSVFGDGAVLRVQYSMPPHSFIRIQGNDLTTTTRNNAPYMSPLTATFVVNIYLFDGDVTTLFENATIAIVGNTLKTTTATQQAIAVVPGAADFHANARFLFSDNIVTARCVVYNSWGVFFPTTNGYITGATTAAHWRVLGPNARIHFDRNVFEVETSTTKAAVGFNTPHPFTATGAASYNSTFSITGNVFHIPQAVPIGNSFLMLCGASISHGSTFVVLNNTAFGDSSGRLLSFAYSGNEFTIGEDSAFRIDDNNFTCGLCQPHLSLFNTTLTGPRALFSVSRNWFSTLNGANTIGSTVNFASRTLSLVAGTTVEMVGNIVDAANRTVRNAFLSVGTVVVPPIAGAAPHPYRFDLCGNYYLGERHTRLGGYGGSFLSTNLAWPVLSRVVCGTTTSSRTQSSSPSQTDALTTPSPTATSSLWRSGSETAKAPVTGTLLPSQSVPRNDSVSTAATPTLKPLRTPSNPRSASSAFTQTQPLTLTAAVSITVGMPTSTSAPQTTAAPTTTSSGAPTTNAPTTTSSTTVVQQTSSAGATTATTLTPSTAAPSCGGPAEAFQSLAWTPAGAEARFVFAAPVLTGPALPFSLTCAGGCSDAPPEFVVASSCVVESTSAVVCHFAAASMPAASAAVVLPLPPAALADPFRACGGALRLLLIAPTAIQASTLAQVVVVSGVAVAVAALPTDPSAWEPLALVMLLLGGSAPAWSKDAAHHAQYLLSPVIDIGPTIVVFCHVGAAVGVLGVHAVVTAVVARQRGVQWRGAWPAARFPSVSFAVASLLYPGAAFGTARIVGDGAERAQTGAKAATVAGAVFLIVVPALGALALVRGVDRAALTQVAPVPAPRTWIRRVLCPAREWVSADAARSLHSITGFARERYLLWSAGDALCVVLFAAMVVAPPHNSHSSGPLQAAAGALLLLRAVLVAASRPYRVRLSNWLTVGTTAAVAAGTAVQAAWTMGPSENNKGEASISTYSDAVVVCAATATALSAVRTVHWYMLLIWKGWPRVRYETETLAMTIVA